MPRVSKPGPRLEVEAGMVTLIFMLRMELIGAEEARKRRRCCQLSTLFSDEEIKPSSDKARITPRSR